MTRTRTEKCRMCWHPARVLVRVWYSSATAGAGVTASHPPALTPSSLDLRAGRHVRPRDVQHRVASRLEGPVGNVVVVDEVDGISDLVRR